MDVTEQYLAIQPKLRAWLHERVESPDQVSHASPTQRSQLRAHIKVGIPNVLMYTSVIHLT